MVSSTKKEVSFDEITVIEFNVVLGDNPACSSGAPIQLGWNSKSKETFDLDIYEYMVKTTPASSSSAKKEEEKAVSKRSSRSRSSETGRTSSKRYSVPQRAQILIDAGYSLSEIATAVMKVQEIQKQRAESIQANGLRESMQLLVETTQRLPSGMIKGVLKGFTSMNGNQRQQQQQKTVQARMA